MATGFASLLAKLTTWAFLPAHGNWGDFYLDISLSMSVDNILNSDNITESDFILFNSTFPGIGVVTAQDLKSAYFAFQFAVSYDQAMRGGWALSTYGGSIGGGLNQYVRVSAMAAVLAGIMKTSTLQGNDLLTSIGPAVQAYWLGAQFAVPPIGLSGKPMPKIPLPYFVSYMPFGLINGTCLVPGIWTPIPILTTSESEYAWLFNFIVSANLHLLTLSGIITANVQYPPPAPPGPTVVPWISYFVPPLTLSPKKLDLRKSLPSLTGRIWGYTKAIVIRAAQPLITTAKRNLATTLGGATLSLAINNIIGDTVQKSIPYPITEEEKKIMVDEVLEDPGIQDAIKSDGNSGGGGAQGTF